SAVPGARAHARPATGRPAAVAGPCAGSRYRRPVPIGVGTGTGGVLGCATGCAIAATNETTRLITSTAAPYANPLHATASGTPHRGSHTCSVRRGGAGR